jgi:hypothetical protein
MGHCPEVLYFDRSGRQNFILRNTEPFKGLGGPLPSMLIFSAVPSDVLQKPDAHEAFEVAGVRIGPDSSIFKN